MAVVDDPKTLGRARLDFARDSDIDEFVDMLGRLQRQDDVQMLRIKIPQGIVTGSQMRALADVATNYSRGFCHITTRQNIQFHFVKLADAERSMREPAAE